jgi:phage terminase large subunit
MNRPRKPPKPPKLLSPEKRQGFRQKHGIDYQTALRLATPDGFAELRLGMQLYPKQREVLKEFKPGARISFASCNSGGKTSRLLPAMILYFLFYFPKGRVACTSGKFLQIEQQIMPALWQYKSMFPDWKWMDSPYIETEEHGWFVGFSTKKPGFAEGFHDDGPEVPLLFIVDEAKSAEPWLEGVVEGRINPTILVLMSSHGFAEGWFYDSQSKRAADFKCITQRAEDCPHLSPQYILDTRRKWGNTGLADSILGHGFMNLVEDAVLDYKSIDALLRNPPEWGPGEIHAGCDFAWSSGGDESAMYLRNGNRLTLELAFREEGLHKVCDRFERRFRELGLSSNQISGDEGGGGQLIMDELDRRGWHLQRWNNGAAAKDDEHFQDCKAECWYNFSELCDMRRLILPDDPDLRNQLINRKRIGGSKGRLAIETKADMKERGVPSPDRADAAVLAAMPKEGWSSGSVGQIQPMTIGAYQQIGGA